jgi:ketosteroid isomerase-like protein
MTSLTRKAAFGLLCAASTAMTACNREAPVAPAAAAAVSEADAAAAADAAQAAWTSMDAAKIEAVYAPEIVAFDPGAPALSTSWDNWHKLQQGFAAMKLDKVSVPDRKLQLLDSNTFVASGTANFTSTNGAVKKLALRFTDVYRKQADGRWLIVNEHASIAPPASAAAG